MSADAKTRIAITACEDFRSPGGVSRSILRIAKGLSRYHDLAVDLISLTPSASPTPIRFIAENPAIIRITAHTPGASTAFGWSEVVRALGELQEQRRYSLFHAFYLTNAAFPTVLTARENNVPSLVTISGSDLNRDIFDGAKAFHAAWALRACDQFTTVSDKLLLRARLLSELPSKGIRIHNGIDPDEFESGCEELRLNRPLIGSAGIFSAKKDLTTILQAFSGIAGQNPEAHLLLIGDVEPDSLAAYRGFLAASALTGRVTLTGLVPAAKVLRYLRALDVFVFASLYEGCPNVVLEAMLAAVPIVTASVGAVPQLIDDGVHGFLVPPGSATALQQGIARALSPAAEGIGVRAQQHILTNFTARHEVATLFQVYQQFLSHQA